MILDHCGYERPCVNLAMAASDAYEFIYINNSQKVPYRTYMDYIRAEYGDH